MCAKNIAVAERIFNDFLHTDITSWEELAAAMYAAHDKACEAGVGYEFNHLVRYTLQVARRKTAS